MKTTIQEIYKCDHCNKTLLQVVLVLNLHACLGWNHYKWDEVANIEVTVVKLDE